MKIRILFLFFIICNLCTINLSFSNELIGPKVQDLQLGMPMQDAKDIANTMINKCINKGVNYKLYHILPAFEIKDTLSNFKIPLFYFNNCQPVVVDDNFLSKFCDAYKIPSLQQVNRDTYEYNGGDYLLRVFNGGYNSYVEVFRISKKNTNLEFK